MTAEGQDFTPSLEYCSSLARESHRTSPSLLCSASTVTSTILNTTSVCVRGGENTHFACPLPGQFLQFIICLQSQNQLIQQFELGPPTNPPDAMQGERFEVLLICFFSCLFPKNQSTAASSIVPYIEYSVIN